MRSTSVTPPPDHPRPSTSAHRPPALQGDDDDIILISEHRSTPKPKPFSPFSPSSSIKRRPTTPTASPSKTKPKTALQLKKDAGEAEAESSKKRGKKRAYDKDEEFDDERSVSEELKPEKRAKMEKMEVDEEDKKGSLKKRGYKLFTVEEDKHIVEEMLNSFNAASVKRADGRSSTAVWYRSRLLLKTALRQLHGEEHAVLPGEAASPARR